MELRHYLQMVIKSWYWVALTTLTAIAISFAISLISTPKYQATTTFIVMPSATMTQGGDVYYSLDVLDKRSIISTYADIATSDRLFNETALALGLGAEYQLNSASKRIPLYLPKATVVSGSNILKLTVEGPDPEIATRLANNLGQHAIDYISRAYQAYDVNVLDIARQPESPASPRPLRDAGIATALGLVVGCLLAITSEELRVPLLSLRERRITDRVSTALSKKYFLTSLEKERVSKPDSSITLALLSFTGLEDLMEGFPEALSIKLLRNITSKLRFQLHGNDIVCRWNETTFGILLPDTPAEPATRTIEKIRSTFVSPVSIDSNMDKVVLAPVAGIATSENGANTVSLIRQAEFALEHARLAEKPTVLYNQDLEKFILSQNEPELS